MKGSSMTTMASKTIAATFVERGKDAALAIRLRD
jgi:hypothetical protein